MVAVSIPMVLLIAPLAGGYLGHRVDGYFQSRPWGILAGIVLGLLAAALRIRALLRKL